MGFYVSLAPFLLGAVFFSLSFNCLFSICYALLSFKYLSDMQFQTISKFVDDVHSRNLIHVRGTNKELKHFL